MVTVTTPRVLCVAELPTKYSTAVCDGGARKAALTAQNHKTAGSSDGAPKLQMPGTSHSRHCLAQTSSSVLREERRVIETHQQSCDR